MAITPPSGRPLPLISKNPPFTPATASVRFAIDDVGLVRRDGDHVAGLDDADPHVGVGQVDREDLDVLTTADRVVRLRVLLETMGDLVALGVRLKSTTCGQPAGVSGSQARSDGEDAPCPCPASPGWSVEANAAPVTPPASRTASDVATAVCRNAVLTGVFPRSVIAFPMGDMSAGRRLSHLTRMT